MTKINIKSEETAGLDLEHELPAGDGGEVGASSGAVAVEAAGAEGELQKLKAERDSLVDRLARAQAEFENARGGEQRAAGLSRYATLDAIRTLLPVIDSFDRALQVKSEAGDFRSGVELIYKQLQDALAKLGVREIPGKGEPFDRDITRPLRWSRPARFPTIK